MRFAILDDEKAERERTFSLVLQWAEDNLVSCDCELFENGETFLARAESVVFDIVLMDIYMGDDNGINVAERYLQNNKSILIFLTSSDLHMSDAFSCHAFDYIVKPVQRDKLFKTLSEASSLLPDKGKYINLCVGKNTIPILFSEIQYVNSDLNYCIVHSDKDYRCRMSFGSVEELLLSDSRFYTVNRGMLVNFDYVEKIENTKCCMKSGDIFPVNIKKESLIKQALISHRFDKRVKRVMEKK